MITLYQWNSAHFQFSLVCCQSQVELGGTTNKSILHRTMEVGTQNLLLKPSIRETHFYFSSKCCQCCVKLSSMKFEGILYEKLDSAPKIILVSNPQSMRFIGGRKLGTPHLPLEPYYSGTWCKEMLSIKCLWSGVQLTQYHINVYQESLVTYMYLKF